MPDMSNTFAALGDATRFAIVERLLAAGPQSAGDLLDVADISAPAISRHLKVLRLAGLIEQEVRGARRIYSIRPEGLRTIDEWVRHHRQFWETSLDRLAAEIARAKEEGSSK